jgi:hypothetical protein
MKQLDGLRKLARVVDTTDARARAASRGMSGVASGGVDDGEQVRDDTRRL